MASTPPRTSGAPDFEAWRAWVETQVLDQAGALRNQSVRIGAAQKQSATQANAAAVSNGRIEIIEVKGRVPAAPIITNGGSSVIPGVGDFYGMLRSVVQFTSTPATGDINGQPVDVARYELWGGYYDEGSLIREEILLAQGEDYFGDGSLWLYTITGIDPGQEWRVRARAVSSSGVPGEFSEPYSLTTAVDVSPPDNPSTPTATSRSGQVIISWDGLDAGGNPQPTDYSHTDVLMATSALGAGVTVGKILNDGDTFIAPETPYGQERWFYLVSVDYSGNRSSPSGRVSITPMPSGEDDLSDDVTDTINQAVQDAADAQQAAQDAVDDAVAALLAANAAVKEVSTEYAQNSSPTVPPASGWSTTSPAHTPGTYIWMRQITTYGDNTTDTSSPVLVTGNTGPKGEDGAGIEIAGTVATYSALPTGLGPGDAGKAYLVTDDGKLYIWDGTAFPANGNGVEFRGPEGQPGAPGDPGDPGAPGVSVDSITPYYRLVGTGSPAPTKPLTNPPGSGWTVTEPAWTADTELYRTELIVLSDATFGYTDVSKVSAYTGSSQAITVANLAQASADGKVKASQTDPGHDVGRIWLVLNGAGNCIGIRISNGSAWTSYTLMADQILVPSSVGPVSIADGAITAPKVQARSITADKMVIADNTNYFQDPEFNLDYTPWEKYSTPGYIQKMGTGALHGAIFESTQFPVVPGDEIIATANASAYTGPVADPWGMEVRVTWRQGNGTTIGLQQTLWYANNSTGGAGVYTVRTAPANAAFGVLSFYTTSATASNRGVRFWNLLVRKRVGGELIVDGAITGNKISGDAIDGKTITGALVRSAASGARTEMTNQGLRTLNAAGQELVKVGYGITTGMEVRNPYTNTLMPLANAAFGTASVSATAALSYPLSPSTATSYTRHSADTLTLTFTAPSTAGTLSWGQVWLFSSGTFGTQSPVVYVQPVINGSPLTTSVGAGGSNYPVFATSAPRGLSLSALEDWSCNANTSISVATTPGASFTVQLQFRYITGAMSATTCYLVNRFISFTPSFQ